MSGTVCSCGHPEDTHSFYYGCQVDLSEPVTICGCTEFDGEVVS